MSRKHPELPSTGLTLSKDDVEGAVRVFQSLEKLVTHPRLVRGPPVERSQLILLAKKIQALRAQRGAFFAPELFGEPAWDILISVYIAEREQYRMKISAVCHESGVPDTTALRWLETLIELGLVRKETNPTDARSKHVALTKEGLEQMDRLLEAVSRNGPVD